MRESERFWVNDEKNQFFIPNKAIQSAVMTSVIIRSKLPSSQKVPQYKSRPSLEIKELMIKGKHAPSLSQFIG
jgi:hypothetical protein